jgi:regulator of sirC expression with transglutaminase-like and TPR domain
VTARLEAEALLRSIAGAPEAPIDLGEAALALAVFDRPRAVLTGYRTHLNELARDVGELGEPGNPRGSDLQSRADALNSVIFGQHGYAGDSLTYDDVQNANLIRVIDRRKGLPVALGILYIQIARAQGWKAVGLNFPGHFLIRLEDSGNRLVIDPFHNGMARSPAELRDLVKLTAGLDAELSPADYAAVSDRDILIRLQNNIKTRNIQNGRIEQALETIREMLLFAPEIAALWHQAGALNLRLENFRAAIEAFERFIAMSDQDDARRQAAAVVQSIRARLN